MISLSKPLNSTSWLSAIYDYRIQSVAAPEGGDREIVLPRTQILELREWESIIENFKFSLNFSKFLLKFSGKTFKIFN